MLPKNPTREDFQNLMRETKRMHEELDRVAMRVVEHMKAYGKYKRFSKDDRLESQHYLMGSVDHLGKELMSIHKNARFELQTFSH